MRRVGAPGRARTVSADRKHRGLAETATQAGWSETATQAGWLETATTAGRPELQPRHKPTATQAGLKTASSNGCPACETSTIWERASWRAYDRAMTRLIHLNGPPGIGKSTIGRLHVAANPGVLNCDIDVLRTLIGGWEADFDRAGALIRPAALAMISAYLSSGHDVVVPQLIVKAEGLRAFEAAARAAEASFHEIVLMDDREGAVARFRGRPDTHGSILAAVEAGGGDQMLRDYYDELVELVAQRPDAVLVTSTLRRRRGDLRGCHRCASRVTSAPHRQAARSHATPCHGGRSRPSRLRRARRW